MAACSGFVTGAPVEILVVLMSQRLWQIQLCQGGEEGAIDSKFVWG